MHYPRVTPGLRRHGRTVATLLLAAGTLLLSRCISAEERDTVKYDPVKDEFHMLMVLTDIGVKDDDDLAYLLAVYRNRDYWIAPVVPGAANLLSLVDTTYVRGGDSELAEVNIFGGRPSQLTFTKTRTSLKDITIIPGTFFLEGKRLGYYQAVTIPGKTIDGALDEMAQKMPSEMQDGLQAELDRRLMGGRVHTWAEFKDRMLKSFTPHAPSGEAKAESSIEPLSVLDEQSLRNLKKALAQKTLRITRQKQVFSLKLPLTMKDAVACADLAKTVSQRLSEVIASAKGKPEDENDLGGLRSGLALLGTVNFVADEKGLALSLDILKFAPAAAAVPGRSVDMSAGVHMSSSQPANQPTTKPELPDVVAFFRRRNIPIDDKLTADEILKSFNAGTLKAYPSETPPKPGEGIAKPKTPAQTMP